MFSQECYGTRSVPTTMCGARQISIALPIQSLDSRLRRERKGQDAPPTGEENETTESDILGLDDEPTAAYESTLFLLWHRTRNQSML